LKTPTIDGGKAHCWKRTPLERMVRAIVGGRNSEQKYVYVLGKKRRNVLVWVELNHSSGIHRNNIKEKGANYIVY